MNRKLNRMAGYDYALNCAYFITICVQNRVCCFGNVEDGVMHLNAIGRVGLERLLWLEQQYEYVQVPHYTVMPNHIHAIVEINSYEIAPVDAAGKTSMKAVKSLSSIVGAYKTTSSKCIREGGLTDFAWQRSFHDHIIRHKAEYDNIANYIYSNPENWLKDTFFIG